MATLTQEEMDKLIADRGGSALVHSNAATKKRIVNPAYDPNNLREGAPQQYIDVDVEQWKSPQGHTIQAIHLPDGTWDVIQDEAPPPKPASSTTSSGTPQVPVGSVPNIEGTPIGPLDPATGRPVSGQYDNTQPVRAWHTPDGKIIYDTLTPQEKLDWEKRKNGGRTDAEVAADRNKPRQSRPNPADPTRMQEFDPATGQWVDAGVNQAGVQAQKPKTTREPDPKHPGLYIVSSVNPTTGTTDTHYENAAGQRVEAPPDKEEILQGRGPNGEDVRVIRDPTTGRVVRYEPIEGGASKNPLIPAGAPRYTPDYTKDDLGLADYNEQLQQAARDGIITRQQGQQLIEQAGGLAQTTATHGSTLRTQAGNLASQAITQRGQDLTEVQSRRTAADSMFKDLFARYHDPAHGGMTGEEGLASQAFLAALDLAKGNTQQYGGLTDVPQVPPAYTMALGAPTPTTTISPDGTISVNHAPAAPATPPNAIGAGGIGSVTPPGAPPAAGPKPPPIFTPQPVAPPPTPVNPLPGQPGSDPTKPVGVIPPSNSVMALGGPTPPPAFSPDVAAIKAAIPGISDAELQQALAEHQQEMAGVG